MSDDFVHAIFKREDAGRILAQYGLISAFGLGVRHAGDTADRVSIAAPFGQGIIAMGDGTGDFENLVRNSDGLWTFSHTFLTQIGLGVRREPDTANIVTLGELFTKPALALGDGTGVHEYLSRNSDGLWHLDAALRASIVRDTSTKTASWTFALVDAHNVVLFNHATVDGVGTIPPNSSVAFPIGTELRVAQLGNAELTIVGGSGVTLTAPTGWLHGTSTPHATLTYRQRAADVWTLVSSSDLTGVGLAFQVQDDDLDDIAGLTATTDNVIQSVAGVWASRTPAQLKATLALVKGDVGLGNVDNTADSAKTFAASAITSATMATARLGSGTADSGSFLRGDQTWQAIGGGGDMLAANNLSDLTNVATARTNLGIESVTTFSNAPYTALATDRTVLQIGTMSTTRTVTLPAANAVPAGYRLLVADASGTSIAPNSIIVARAGSDTVNGGTLTTISVAYGSVTLISDGTSKWLIDAARLFTANNLSDLPSVSAARTNLGLVIGTNVAPVASPTFTGTLTAGVTTLGATSFQLAGLNAQTNDYTLVLTDGGKLVKTTKATAIAVTIPANASVAFPVLTIIYLMNTGAGTMTLGITSDTLTGATSFGPNKGGYIIKDTATTWRSVAGA